MNSALTSWHCRSYAVERYCSIWSSSKTQTGEKLECPEPEAWSPKLPTHVSPVGSPNNLGKLLAKLWGAQIRQCPISSRGHGGKAAPPGAQVPREQTTGWAGMVESKALWFIGGWGQVDLSLG